jgi:enamine deaminase RidA (YjgF/YER057c/UK114 family)
MKSIYELATAAGVDLPMATKPVGIYQSFVWDDELLYVSGQVPVADGHLQYRDSMSEFADLKTYEDAARLCGLNILAQVGAATDGRACRSIRCIKLTGYVAASRSFDQHPRAINGASDVIGKVLGQAGHHARSSVGVASLPNNALVEVEALFRICIAANLSRRSAIDV